jgi:hypothetical protein
MRKPASEIASVMAVRGLRQKVTSNSPHPFLRTSVTCWIAKIAVQAEIPNRSSVMSVKSPGGKRLRRGPVIARLGMRREDEHG